MPGISITEASGVADSLFGKIQAPLRLFLLKQGEAFEAESMLPHLFAISASKHFGEMSGGLTSMADWEPVGENGTYPVVDFEETFRKLIINETWKSSFSISRELVDDATFTDLRSRPQNFTDERTRRALERARENDSNNRDATRRVTSPAISGGSETTRSRTERALQSAKKKDRETKLITPSREQSGSAGGQVSSPMISGTRSSVGQMLESTMNRFSDRGLIDTYTNPDKWDTSSEAEAGMRQWSGELSDMEQRLTTQADSLSGMQTELSTLENNLNTQANVDRYNALVEQYNSALGTYSHDSDEYNRLRDRYSRGLTRYRDILSSGMERANEYAAEAELLSTRNSAIEDELRRYELGLPYFDGLASGVSTGERMSRLQREYDSNQARIDQLLSDADKSRMEYYSSLRMAEDWEQNSTAIGSQRLAQLNAGETPYYGGGVVYDYINDIGGARDSLRGYDSTGTQYAAYGTMTPDEIGIYNYLYATQGADAAEEFLSEMRETLNYRLGTQNYENMSGFGKALYWIPAGLSQFTSGIEQLFSREAVPTSPTLYTSSLIQQEAQAKSPVLGTLYELGTTLSNMAPSVLASALGGWALGGTGMAAGTAARVAGLGGSAMLGASAGGNAYTQALNEGRSTDEARTYATLIGASEGALQYLLGGIGSLGGIGVRSIASKIGALDNVLGRIASSTAGKLVGNMISEGTEEGLQELLEPAFRTLVFDEEYNADFGDVAYSFLLGALSAGIIDAPGAVREGIQQRRQPSAPDFSIMEGYIGEDGADNFQGVRTLEELDARYMEMAESENAEALDWENIVNQYKMARTFLIGMNAQENSQVQEASSEAAASPLETGGVVLPTSEELDARERLASATDDLERSGISAGVSEENIAAAQRISSALGRRVRFYDGAAETGPAQVANGYYLDGTIYVNSRSTNPVAQIIAHELTHSVEMADAYGELSSLVLDHIQQSGVDLQQLRQSKRERYERNGVQLSSDADLDSEIVAEYIEKNLLTDEESIRTLTQNNRSLGERILTWLNELLARLGNADARERAFVAEARDAYSRALAETAPAEQSQTTEQAAPAAESSAEQAPEPETDTEANTEEPPSRASLRQLREDYAAGRLTDEEFDSALDAIEEQESLEGRSAFDSLQFSIDNLNQTVGRLAELLSGGGTDVQNVDTERTTPLRRSAGLTIASRRLLRDGSTENISSGEDVVNTEGALAGEAESVENEARYSIDENYEQDIDDWDSRGRPDGEVFILGRTGDVLQGLGAREQDIYLRSEKVNDIMEKHPEMTLSEIKRIPEVLDDPVIIAKSSGQSRGGQNTRLTMFGELFTQNGEPVMAILDLRPVENGVVINDMQKVNSAYQRRNSLNYLRRSELLYVDENRAIPLLQTMGLQIRPTELQRYGSLGNISYNRQNVNIEGVPFDEVVGTADSPQYSISQQRDRGEMLDQLRRYINGEIDTGEIRAYIDGVDDAQTEESSAAQSIIDQAHSEGMSVDEYLRQNWDEYEYDGELNETARRALELEREQARRRYSVSDPERVIIAPGGETIIENPTDSEYRAMSNETYQDFPWLWNTGETVVNVRQEPDGTRYIWSKSDGDAFPLNAQYSVDDGTVLPTAAQSEYDEVYNRMPAKVRASMRRAENALLTGLGRALSVPNAERHGELRDVVHDLELEYLNSGTVSQEVRDELFARAYDAGVIIDREFYDQYKGVRDYLRATNIDVGDEVQADIPDFNDFRDSMLGRMKIRTRYGTNIDQVYQDLNERWPELFPDNIIVPSDQMLKMAEAAQNIEVVQRSLDEYAGRDAKMFREAMRREFDTMVAKLIDKLRDVQRYMYDQENPDAVNAGIPVPQSAEEAAALWQQVKPLRRAYERTLARTLLTRSDEQKVNDLMRGQMRLENLDPETDNVAGITAVYQAKQAYESVIKPLRVWNQQRKAQLRERADQLLENANDWKDKRAGIMYSRETMERNIRDIVTDPNDAEAIISEYFTPVHEATANANRMKNSYRDRVRALDLSRRVADGNVVSEAHAVQLLGEAEDNIRMMEQSRGRIKARDGKSLSDWRAIVQNLWKENPNLDEQKIRGAVDEFRAIYDELFQQMNDVRVRNGYEPINYRSGYFPHFQPGEGDGILSQFGRVLGIDTQVTALPTTINGLTHTFRPGITWFGNAQERIGFNTVYDAVEGFDKYIEGVSDVITQTDNIQRLRALASQIRYRTTDDGIRAQIDTVRADPNKTEEDKQNKINEIYQEARFTLSNFVVQLDEYTNLLANKKSSLDRTVEGLVGRNRLYNFMKWFEGRVAANMVAINPASWLTNFVPLTQGWAGIGTRDLAVGLWDTLKAIKNDDGIIAKSTFLTNRMGSDPIVHAWEKDPEPESAVGKAFWNIGMKAGQWGDRLSYPMQFIDQIVSGALVRGRYYQNLGKGLSNDAAMADADAFAANVMADRSKGAVPTLFQSHNPFVKLLTQFQLEVNNQLGFIFKDIPREYRKYGIRALSTAIFKFVIGAWLFDELYEWLIGRRPALDPIGIAVDTFEDLSGWEIPNLVELGRGERPYRVEEQQGLFQTSTNLITNLAENLPFSSVFSDGGRLPISSAIPDLGALAEAILDDDKSPERRKQEIAKELGRLGTYALLPFGGGQLNRIYDTIRAVSEGGVYTYNDEGERLLQYPVYTDTAEQAIKNTLGAGIFGTTSLPTGREWIEDGFPTLTAEQTAVYQGMLDAGVSGEDAYDLIQEIRDIDSAEGKRYAIQQADISGDGKSVAYYGLFANNNEKALMDEMAGAGADMGEVTNTLIGIKQAASLKGAEETDFKLRAIIAADLTDDEKMQIYRGVISDKQDEDILSFLDAGLSFDQYLQAKREYAIIDENTENSDERAVEFANWVNEQGFTRDQAEVVQELAPMSGNLGKLADAGMDIESASDVANALDNLGDDATSTEEYMAIAQMPISEPEKELALEAIMSESAFEKYERANSAGIDTYDYCLFLDTISGYSGDGRQEQVWAYIDSMPLTSAQKDALHLAAGYKESTLRKTPWH